MAMKYLDDHAGTIQDRDARGAFQIAQLARTDLVIDGDQLQVVGLGWSRALGIRPVIEVILVIAIIGRYGLAASMASRRTRALSFTRSTSTPAGRNRR